MKAQDKIVAQQKVNSSAHTVSSKALQKKAISVVQKVETEEELQQQKSDGTIQKMETSELEEEHPEDVVQNKSEAGAEVENTPTQLRENKTGMPDNLKSGIENLSGMSMDHVKVHYNSAQPAQLNALAYAQGSDIHIGPGQEKHLPHEAWHVVQQAQGRVQATTQMKMGVPVNDDPGLEHEADVMGAKALTMPDTTMLSTDIYQNKAVPLVAQFVMTDEELREDWLDMDEEEWNVLEEEDIIRLKVLKRIDEALGSIKDHGTFKTWKYNGIDYHVNVRSGETNHVTSETSPKIHYFFDGFGSDIKDKRCTKREQGSHPETKKVFSGLPSEVQAFVKAYMMSLI